MCGPFSIIAHSQEQMLSKTTLGVAGAAAVGFIGYCLYFDHKRRKDPSFKLRLRERNNNSVFFIFGLLGFHSPTLRFAPSSAYDPPHSNLGWIVKRKNIFENQKNVFFSDLQNGSEKMFWIF